MATATLTGDASLLAATLLSVDTISAAGSTRLDAGGGLAAGRIDSGGRLEIEAGAGIALDEATTRSGDLTLLARTGSIRAGLLSAAEAVSIHSTDDVTLGDLRSGATASLVADTGALAIASLSAATDATLQGRSIVFTRIEAGGSATLLAQADIAGSRISAADALTLQAGRSGRGSIAIAIGAARNVAASTLGDISLGRFGAGDGIVILGRRITADIVQLPGEAGTPLALDIGGLDRRTAEEVALSIEADRIRIGRFDAVDGRIAATASRLEIARAFVPGALELRVPAMSVLASNRSIVPVGGYDVQLYPNHREFSLVIDGRRLTSSAFVTAADTDVVDVPAGSGPVSQELARLGAVFPTGLSFADIMRGFVLGSDGRWRSKDDPETTASIAGLGGRPPVNLDGIGEQP